MDTHHMKLSWAQNLKFISLNVARNDRQFSAGKTQGKHGNVQDFLFSPGKMHCKYNT